jgi:hypothetical protein
MFTNCIPVEAEVKAIAVFPFYTWRRGRSRSRKTRRIKSRRDKRRCN